MFTFEVIYTDKTNDIFKNIVSVKGHNNNGIFELTGERIQTHHYNTKQPFVLYSETSTYWISEKDLRCIKIVRES